MLQMTKELTRRLLLAAAQAGVSAVDGPLVGAKLILGTANIAGDANTLLADLAEATFPGYAPSGVIVWGAPFRSSIVNAYVIPGDAKTFTSTGGEPPETVRSYGIISADATPVLLAFEMLDVAEEMSDGNVKVLLPRIGINSLAITPPGVEALT